jgi:hypothetical protein
MRRPLVLLVALALLATVVPLAPDGVAPAAAVDEEALDWGDLLAEPMPMTPPDELEPMEVFTGGAGGFIPVSDGDLPVMRSVSPGSRALEVTGATGVPETGVGTVVIELTVRRVADHARLTLWTAGAPRPGLPTLEVDASRDWSTLVVAAPGRGGALTLHLEGGRVDVHPTILGWFPADQELIPVGPTQVLSTLPATAPTGAVDVASVCRTPYASSFTDIRGSAHEENIRCMADYGLTTGLRGGTEYGPRLDVTRAQMASFIARFIEHYTGETLEEGRTFRDVAPDNVHASNISKLAHAGVTEGTQSSDGREFAPQLRVTRAQMASFISRALTYVKTGQGSPTVRPPRAGTDHFPDDDGSVHEDNIDALAEVGIVTGFRDGSYGPGAPVKRDQMASFIMRAFAWEVGPPGGLRPDAVLDVKVAGVAGVPTRDVGTVLLRVTAPHARGSSDITIWPTGDRRPASPSLTTEATRSRTNLVLVAPGTDGRVSVHNQAGRPHLTVEVLGWLPDDGAYRPLAPSRLLDSTALAAGGFATIQVAGEGGVPGDEELPDDGLAQAVALQLTIEEPAAGTRLQVGPAGYEGIGRTRLVAGDHRAGEGPTGRGATVALAVVTLGEDGNVLVENLGPATRLRVDVVGWFALPAEAAELAVPESTKIIEDALVESVADDGTIVLRAGAEPLAVGDHVVLGMTEETPDGYLAEVTRVTNLSGGRQQIRTVEAHLNEVFPEGELILDLAGADYEVVATTLDEESDGGATLTVTAQSSRGPTVDFVYESSAEGECDLDTGITVDFKPEIAGTFHARWRFMKAPLVTSLVTFTGEATAVVDNPSLECSLEFELHKIERKFMAGPVPVMITLELAMEILLDAGLTGVRLEAGVFAGLVMGVKDNAAYVGCPDRGGATACFDFRFADNLAANADNLGGYAMLDVWLTAWFTLYGRIGPQLALGPFLEAQVTSAYASPWWALDLGFAGRVSMKLDLWFKSWNWRLFEGEIPIARWVGLRTCVDNPDASPPRFDTGVCRTPKPTTRVDGSTRNVMAERFRLVGADRSLAPRIVTETLPKGAIRQSYAPQQLRAEGLFVDSLEWEILDGRLPAGMSLSKGGVLSGTPSRSGTYEFTVRAWYGAVTSGVRPPTATLTLVVDGDEACWRTLEYASWNGLVTAVDEAPNGALLCLDTGGNPFDPYINEAGELVIPAGKSLTFRGDPEHGTTFDGGHPHTHYETSRLLRLEPGATLTLEGIEITGGYEPDDHGGGVLVEGGAHLLLDEQSWIRANVADYGGGVALLGDDTHGQARVTVRDGGIDDNAAGVAGGVFAHDGVVHLDGDGQIRNNEATDYAGGVSLFGGALTMEGRSTVSDNDARLEGGGVVTHTGTVVSLRDDATIETNAADRAGGGIFMDAGSVDLRGNAQVRGNTTGARGGGIAVRDGATGASITLRDTSRVQDNHAAVDGGGIYRASVIPNLWDMAEAVRNNTPNDISPAL